ncbi:MAG: UvrD-helicase domain-containing protein [Candidatus Aenigmarchaeota archaeon]|nr:UvrD-helicase domain-containing protein [Candidatus Aenigmarchaeota archaeon]
MPLNPSQQKAVEEDGELLVVAGPGSGKTKVITQKILHLIRSGVNPENILALTFSDKAAGEMAKRLEKEIDTSSLTISTFHSFCLDVLKDNVLDSGISFSSGLISRTNQLVWALKNIDSFGFEYTEIGNNEIELIEAIIDGISAFRDELITPEELEAYLKKKDKQELSEEKRDFQNKLKDLLKVYKAYEHYKRKEMLLDFDDMIHEASELFDKKPLILKKYRERYKYVLADEFQDTNYAQLYLLKQLAGEHLCVVGDDDQSIYRFRGAYLTNFKDFKSHFKKHKGILLDYNYRNSNSILALALQLMKKAPNREEKKLITKNEDGEKITAARCENEQAEAEFVLKEIRKLIGKEFFSRTDQKERELNYSDIAILSRRKAEGIKYNGILRKNGIPSEFIGEVNFFSSPVIRDIIAYLRVVENPLHAGIYLNRIMKISGITEVNMQHINACAKKRAWKDDSSDFVFECMEDAGNILASQKEHVAEITNMIKKLLELKEKTTITELVYQVMINYTDLYKKSLEDTIEGHRNRCLLNKFYEITQEYESISHNMSANDFLEYIDMLSGFQIEMEESEDTGSVKIMTVHQSKGKEFPVVFIVDMATNRFPLKYQSKPYYVPNDLSKGMKTGEEEKELYFQEERRLCYVAMTRAEQKLYFLFAEKYGDNKNKTKPSKFLEELSYENNSLIDLRKVKQEEEQSIVEAQSNIEKARHELQKQAAKAVQQMQLKTALQKIAELEKIRLMEETGSLDGFDKQKFFSVEEMDDEIKMLFEGKQAPLVKKDQSFSASAMNTYDECPLKYKFQNILQVPSYTKTYFNLGSAVHEVIENLTNDEEQGIKPAKTKAMEMLERFWSSSAYKTKKKEQEDKALAEQMIDAYLEWTKSNKNEVIGAEMEFNFTLAGKRFHGFIDRVEKTKQGDFIVIDYKTGYAAENSNSIKENIQMNVYCLAILNKFGKLPIKASLFYIKHNKTVDYIPSTESIEEQKQKLEQMISSVLAEQFEAKPSYQACKWCDYIDICDEKEVEED